MKTVDLTALHKDGRARERARIVAWLREPARYREACSAGPLMSEAAFRWLADRIEKGDHVPKASCTCEHYCGEDGLSGIVHQHRESPCLVHPEAPMAGDDP